MEDSVNAGEICNRSTAFIRSYDSATAAARAMQDAHAGSLVVVEEADHGREVVGIVTDRDIALSVVGKDLSGSVVRVGDIMSRDVVTVRPETPLAQVLNLMRGHGVRRIPVTTDDGMLVGILTMDDLLGTLAGQIYGLVETVKSEARHEKQARA